METFPPCAAANHYAVFPCRETCQSLDAVCHKDTPVECPLDGPSIDATTPGNGTHFNSNNELQSCFFLNRTIHDAKCLRSSFSCHNGSYFHPECTHCVCGFGGSGIDCASCGSDLDCTNQTCVHTTSFLHSTLRNMTCEASDTGALADLFGSFRLSLRQRSQTETTVELLSSAYPSFSSSTLRCEYAQCRLLSGADCSTFLSGFNNCLQCDDFVCSVGRNEELRLFAMRNQSVALDAWSWMSGEWSEMVMDDGKRMHAEDAIHEMIKMQSDKMPSNNHQIPQSRDASIQTTTTEGLPYYRTSPALNPMLFFFSSPQTPQPSIFGCHADGSCVWLHNQAYRQPLRCSVGVCMTLPNNSGNTGLNLVAYIVVFNLPIIVIIIYLCMRSNNTPPPKEPTHFDHKPFSVRICQNSSMYAIDEYYDELEDSATLTAENTFCWVDLTHKKFEKIHAKPKGLASRLKQLVKPAKAEVTSIYSPFGFLSTQGGIVTVVGKNGSQFLQSLYGYTDRGDDEISGKLFYNGSPLSPSELLMLVSYVDNRGWLCGSLTVEEYVQQTIELNSPLWMEEEERETQFRDIITDLGLMNDRDTLVRNISHQKQIMLQIALEIQSNRRVILFDNAFTDFTPEDFIVVYKYMQQASRTGILFLVYSKSPTSILYDYSDSMLVLSDSGVVLYYGSISTSRSVLFDPYFDPQPNYNSMDRVYHLLTYGDTFLLHQLQSTFLSSDTAQSILQALPLSQVEETSNDPSSNMSSSHPPSRNPYTVRISEIRETVTKEKRIQNVASRLQRCMTRTSMCAMHCLVALLLSLLLGVLYYNIPAIRAGIEKRENLFHILCTLSLFAGVSSSIFNTQDFPVFVHDHVSRFCPIHIYRIVYFLMDFVYLRILPAIVFLPGFFLLTGLGSSFTKIVSYFIIIVLAFSSCSSLFSLCVGFRPLSILFILYIVFALVYIIATTNGFDFIMHELAYLFPPVVAYRALMYVEFKGTSFDIHIWDHRGAEMTLTGESILRYNGINPSVTLGVYVIVLTVWNVVMLLISYLYYSHICSDMNCYLKSRRKQRVHGAKSAPSRQFAPSTVYEEVVHLNPAEDALLH
ncbi:hypothetical protein WA588_005913, partial [Blastocystis sp. NMH]